MSFLIFDYLSIRNGGDEELRRALAGLFILPQINAPYARLTRGRVRNLESEV
jgi:hypothetical protein